MSDDRLKTPRISSSERMSALDGLRGYSALVVVFCHCLLVFPSFSAAYGMSSDGATTAHWWVTYTPLHLGWAGTEAVYVFFILSGFVLAAGPVRGRPVEWRSYYPQRLLRLYLPVWAAVMVGVSSYLVVAHRVDAGYSGWMQVHKSPVSVQNLIRDVSLMVRPGAFITPLWSLKWEVVFSLLLPVFLVVVVPCARKSPFLTCAGLLLMVSLGDYVSVLALVYLPMFGIGVLLAVQYERLRTAAAELSRGSWLAITTLAVLLITSGWNVGPSLRTQAGPLFRTLEVIGACLLVLLFTHNRRAAALGTFGPIQWVGTRSFSLYLIHEPIVVAAAILLPANSHRLVPVVAVPLSLAASAVFFAAVERPSHRLARRVGQMLAAAPGSPKVAT